MSAPAELTYNERIDLLRQTKMRHTEEKWQVLGAYGHGRSRVHPSSRQNRAKGRHRDERIRLHDD